jgi:tetratricopeptide (TPR) repeat protein
MKMRNDYPERTIITTWQISFDEVERRDIRAAKLLQLWGYLDNQELWYRLLKWPGWENDQPDWLQQIAGTEISFLAAVGILLDFSLVEQNDNSDSYSMHAVVHDWIQASVNTRTDDDFLQTAMTTIGLAVPPEKSRDFATIQRRLLPHVAHLLQYLNSVTETRDDIDTAVYLSSLHMLGDLCAYQGKLVEAEQMYQRALQGYEKAWGPEHTSTLGTVNNLANLYKSQGKLVEAEQMYQRALQGYEKA